MPLRKYTQADLLVSQRNRLEKPLLWLILVASVSFCVAEMSTPLLVSSEAPVFHLTAVVVAFVLNYWAASRQMEVSVHRYVVNGCVAIATLILILETQFTNRLLVIALGHYLILVLTCKLFERKGVRDYAQMLLLALTLMVAVSVINDQAWLLAASVVWLALAVYTAMVLTLHAGLDRAARARLGGEARPMEAGKVAWNVARDWPGRAIAGRTFAALFVLLLAGAGMFVVAPRLPNRGTNMLGSQVARSEMHETGFSRTVLLGKPRKIYESNQVVGQITYEPPAQGPWPKSAGYLRGVVYDGYRRGQWHRAHLAPEDPMTPPLPENGLGETYTQEVQISADLAGDLFVSHPALALESDRGQIAMNGHLMPQITGLRLGTGQQVRYKAWLWPGPLTPRQLDHLARIRPHVHAAKAKVPQRVADLARSWCRDLLLLPPLTSRQRDQRDRAIAIRLAEKLQERCSYSLDLSQVDPQREPLEDFLFHTHTGHCEYFASAHTAMCASLGVRARLATGFMVSPVAGTTLIRQRDAHAWTEVFTDSDDWFIVDATPASSGSTANDDLITSASRWWGTVQYWWDRTVLSFDEAAQEKLAAWIYLAGRSVGLAAKRVARSAWRVIQGLIGGRARDILIAAVTLGILALAGVLITVALKQLRHWRQANRYVVRDYRRLPRFMSALLGLIKAQGLRWRRNQTLLELAQEAHDKLHMPMPELRHLVHLYYRHRWAPTGLDRTQRRQARRMVKRLAAATRD
jgi:protein-glutamine gamma-glutamyltransferase